MKKYIYKTYLIVYIQYKICELFINIYIYLTKSLNNYNKLNNKIINEVKMKI